MVNLFYKFVLSLTLFTYATSINTSNINASSIIFYDDFNDNDVSDWFVARPSCNNEPWQVSNGRYGNLNPGCVTESIPSSLSIENGISYRFELDMYLPETISKDRNFVFKYKDSQNWYGVHIYNNNVFVQKVVNGVEIGSPFWTDSYTNLDSQGFIANNTYHFSIDVYEDKYILSINKVPFPIIFDNSIYKFENYSAGLQASGGDVVWFDNVKVTLISDTPTPTDTPTPIPTSTPTTTVPPFPTIPPTPTPLIPIMDVSNLKQYEGGWENNIYGHTDKTIGQWGCALTSASMVLDYHGHKILPNELNEWLILQPDGFIRNGLINWLAISRYTKENYSPTSRTLEYKRLPVDNFKLDSELLSNQPAILKEDGHFIVATGKRHDEIYTINDPGYSNKTLLSDYSNSYLAINSYTPTDSDLSYMMFIANENIILELIDENGNTVQTQNFTEGPIKDISEPYDKSGDPLSILLHDKPASGKYKLKVTGMGNYNLDTYLYDINGEVTQKTFSGKLSGSDYDIYDLTFNLSRNVRLSTEGILDKIKNALNNNQIKNKGIYTAVKIHLEIFDRINSDKIITLLIKQIENLTPKLINQSFSTTLQLYLHNLIK